MAKLDCLVIADPSREAAEGISHETERLAAQRYLATSGDEALALITKHKPQAMILSLELERPEAGKVAKQLHQSNPELFIVATFRELSVPGMDKLSKAGIDDFIPQPIDYTQLFRAASNRFDTPFRRHERYPIELKVFRADGKLIGTTRDISEGGLQMTCLSPAYGDQSLLLDIALPSNDKKIRVRTQILAVEGEGEGASARGEFQNLRGEEHKRLRGLLSELKVDYKQ